MKKCFHSKFAFLGHRKYVHGPSLTHGLTDALNSWGIINIKKIRGMYHEMLYSNGDYCLFANVEEGNASERKFSSSFVVDYEQGKVFVGLEKNESIISESVPYDEDAMIENCLIEHDKKSAQVCCKKGLHKLNILVALTKSLHLTVLPREGFSQWYFAGYDLQWRPIIEGEDDQLKVVLGSVFNNIYSRSTVFVNDKMIGNIIFAREELK